MKHPFLLRLAGLGFSTGILFLAITAATVMVFGAPETLKSALEQSGAYKSASQQLAKKAGEVATSEESSNDLSVDKAAISQAAETSFTPAAIQKNAEQVIDGTYKWLDGTTAKPEVNLDLRPYVDSFTQSIAAQATQRAAKLPPCTPEQLRQLDPNNIDVFNLPCLPPGINLDSATNQAIAKATESNDFLKDPVVSVDSLPKDAAGETAIDRAANVPQVFQLSMRAPWIFGVLALLSAAAIVALAWQDWRTIIKRLARPLFGTGITLVVLMVIVRVGFSYVTKPDSTASKLAGGEFKDVALSFVSTLQQTYTGKVLVFGVIYLAVGAIGLAALHFLKLRSATTPAAATNPFSTSHSSTSTNTTSAGDSSNERRGDDSSGGSSDSGDSSSSSDGGGSSSD